MLTQRSDPDRIARLRDIAARLRYATVAMVLLLAVFVAIERDRLIASPLSWLILGVYGFSALSRPAATLPLPIKTAKRYVFSLVLSVVTAAFLIVLSTIQFGAPDAYVFLAWGVLALLELARMRFGQLALEEEVKSARLLRVTIPLVDETVSRFRQSDVELDIETNAGIDGVLDRVRNVLRLSSVDVGDDGMRSVSPPVFKIQDLPQLWDSLRSKGVEVDAGEDLTMDSADGAVIHARG